MGARLGIEYVRQVLSGLGLKLLDSVYHNNKTKLNYKCKKCGYENYSMFHTIKYSKGCPRCNKTIHIYKLSDVVLALSAEGYKLNSKKYINHQQQLGIECDRKHNTTIAFRDWIQSCRCHLCYLEDVQKLNLSKLNLPLYSTYAPQLEKYQEVHRVEYFIGEERVILLGVKCAFCDKKYIPSTNEVIRRIVCIKGKNSGESNLYCSEECKKECPTYGQQLYPKGKKPYKCGPKLGDQSAWSKMVKKRDNYTCYKCGAQNKIMVAHHVDPIINNPIESADLDNGITLCKACDKLIHKLPGCLYTELRCKNKIGELYA